MDLNIKLVNQLLEGTEILPTTSPSVYTDLRLGIDRFPKETNLNSMFFLCTEEELDYLYRILIVDWLFDEYNLTGFNWGWYKSGDDEWKELPYRFQSDRSRSSVKLPNLYINPYYSSQGITNHTYHLGGLLPSPDNIMLLSVENSFRDTFSKWYEILKKWYDEESGTVNIDLPVYTIADFMSQIQKKLHEAKYLLGDEEYVHKEVLSIGI